jgi:hypothetical protein
MAHVKSVAIIPKGLDSTGEVCAGSLVISGRRAKAYLNITDEGPSRFALSIVSQDGGTSVSYSPLEWEMLLDITIDRAIEVELLELAVNDRVTFRITGVTTFLYLRLVERSPTDNDCPTGYGLPTFERIGIGGLCLAEDIAMCFQSEPSTIRLI